MTAAMVIGELRSLARRVRALGVLRGTGLLVCSAVASFLIIICLDYVFHLPAVGRLVICAAAIALLAWLLWRWIARPATRSISLLDLAGRIERIFPQFDDRLRSTVNFTDASVPGSPVMKQRVLDETASLFTQIDLRQAISFRPVYQSLAAGAVALVLLALLAALMGPMYRQIAVDRLIHPFDSPRWPKTVQIDLLGNEPARLPVGQPLMVKMKLARGDSPSRKAILFFQQDNGAIQQQYMTRQSDGTYVATVDPRLHSGQLHVWMQSGDDQLHLQAIAIVPRLTIQSVRLEVLPPAYAHLPKTTVDLTARPAVVGVGSRLSLHVEFNKPLGKIDPAIESSDANSSAPNVKWQRHGDKSAEARWIIHNSLRFHLSARDADGFANLAADEYVIVARPDQLPVVQIQNPQRNEERTPQAIIPLEATAEDDYGIDTVQLIVKRLGDKHHWEIPLVKADSGEQGVDWQIDHSSSDQQRYRLDWPWSLKQMSEDLKPGDVLEYHANVRDNFDINGQRHDLVSSGRLQIQIVSQDQLAEHIAEHMRQLAEQVHQTLRDQKNTTEETQNLANEMAGKTKLDAADREILGRLSQQQQSAAARAQQIAGQLQAIQRQLKENQSPNQELNQTAADARDLLNQAAEGPMKQAINTLEALRQTSASPASRSQQIGQTQEDQHRAGQQLNQALQRLGNVGSLNQSIEQIESILKSQREISRTTTEIGSRNLGKTPAQMSAEDQQQLSQNASKQNDLAQKTAAAVAQMRKQATALAKSDPTGSQAMQHAADAAQQQQISASQQRASQEISQNQQADAQSAQMQAELGLETILSALHDAQRAKLAELSRKLADLQSQLARLIVRQAGHNLDNLSIQGKTVVANTGDNTIKQLLKQADRAAMVPADLGDLTAAQEQTQRNTRDIGTSTDKLPGASTAAELLLRSADKMERAGALLEGKQLSAAYDPQQIAALSLLMDAKKKVDDLKSQADKKLAEQTRNSVRAIYTKIKADQEKLNAQTVKLDQSPRLADGSRSRVDAIGVAQLPPNQQSLADQIKELDDRLASLGGIVYLWANHDIHDAMITDKNLLVQSQTGQATQQQQQRIAAELDAMIDSLAVHPPDKEFAQQGGGGGGAGHGKPKQHLPSEVELRLLQQLQLAVNRRTVALNQPAKNPEELRAVGLRQNQLRSLLDELLQKASNGKVKLPPAPPNQNMLPEERDQGDNNLENLAQQLMTDQQATEQTDKDINLLGQRMSRSYQRLALNGDPGHTTQTIEKNIVKGLDHLIQLARQQESAGQSPQQQQMAQQNQQIKSGQAQPSNQQANQQPTHASSPAQTSNVAGSAQAQTDLSQALRQTMQDWGALSARQRQAVLQGASDTIIEKYRTLVDDYYRALADKK